MARPDYVICVPSRKRSGLVGQLMTLLPTAIVVVDEEEADDYLKVLPAERLMFHSGCRNLAAIRQWILDKRPETCVVMCDDDFQCVFSMTRAKRRTYRDAASILQIVETTMQVAFDLDLGLFCWAATGKPMFFEPHKPIRLVAPAMGTFGIIGRKLKFDTRMWRAEDVDLSMQALLTDRVLYQDSRFKFFCGGMFFGTGGNQGLVTSKDYQNATRAMKQKWGDYVLLEGTSHAQRLSGKQMVSERVSVRVRRQSKMTNFK